jgi:hypothetical protein
VADFEQSKHIAILQSRGVDVCHVPAAELEKVEDVKNNMRGGWCGRSERVRDVAIGEVNVQVHNFLAEKSLVKFLAHWIHHHDAEEALKTTIDHQEETRSGDLDEDWLHYMIDAMNEFDKPYRYICDISDSLVDCFIQFLVSGGLDHIDRVYEICAESCDNETLTRVFANISIHDKKEFGKQENTCDYDRAVQGHMLEWLTDVLVNNKDWDKLPPQLGDRAFDPCLHHKHGKDKPCYVHGRILSRG